jgi:cyclic beta-1,2-glucan synthetase
MSTHVLSPPTPSGAIRLLLDPNQEGPIRGELFGLEHLEAHARVLAGAYRVTTRRPSPFLLNRFAQNRRLLKHAYRRMVQVNDKSQGLGVDAEWILDNYYVVEDVLREVRRDLPRGFYRELPQLAEGPFAGFPRIYALALSLIAHTDSNLDETHITRFVRAYQTVAPLSIGELWAVPTMLRLGLLENLRRLAEQIMGAWDHRARASLWVNECLRVPSHRMPKAPISSVESLADAFIAGLMPLLRDPSAALANVVGWLEDHLSRRGTNTTEVVRRDHHRQAANQVSIGNCVTSLHLFTALDWTAFFENTSLVEAILHRDPAGVYALQDFPTRDRYRRAVEKLSRRSTHSELDVARQAVDLASNADTADPCRRHVGYYLTDDGRSRLETQIGYVPHSLDWILAFVRRHAVGVYFGGILAAFLGFLVCIGFLGAAGNLWLGVAAVLASLMLASEVAVALINNLVTLLVPPTALPKLDFREGIPPECPTCVVIPALISSESGIALLVERLELHYLSTPDPGLRFALLTDFADAPAEAMPEDEGLVRHALDMIQKLNARHECEDIPRFFLFHRRRLWNPVQRCWMGWERKRGKLLEFNRLLRGARDTSYQYLSFDPGVLDGTRFVLTLDADTQLPREAAQRLVATLAHPLNQPRFDPHKRRVVSGYGILQPRVSFNLIAARRSWFAHIFANAKGMDPYGSAISDVYQDLFKSGSYTGKGLYDVDAFAAAVGETFPDNHILSHDLIESTYARCALVTDIELMDDFPSRYHAYGRRERRWARGDWQLLPWLLPRVPGPARGHEAFTNKNAAPLRAANPLPLVERWKVFDNLRRTLVPPSLLVLLVLGWTVLPGPAWFWSVLVLFGLALPLVVQAIDLTLQCVRCVSLRPASVALREDLPGSAGRIALTIAFLPDQAFGLTEAIARTLYRLLVSRAHLLEWETAAITEARLGAGLRQFCINMWPASALALACGVIAAAAGPSSLAAAVPLVVLWFFSPLIAYWVSRTRAESRPILSAEERTALRAYARRTWNFFETFIGDEDHWLPPDNFQEDPKGKIAHRTSPTNAGLFLLSTLAAHDLGYLSRRNLVQRLENTFATLERLERYQGHFHNWYETLTLRSLAPGYISTVDSGNFLACLLALKRGLEEKATEPIPNPALRDGLTDALGLLAGAVQALETPTEPRRLEMLRNLEEDLGSIRSLLREQPVDPPKWDDWFFKLEQAVADLPTQARRLADAIKERPEELALWAERLQQQVRDHRAEMDAESDETGASLIPRLHDLATRIDRLAREMNFRFLYNEERHLFSIGFNLGQHQLDAAHYDLLASEACLASYLAIARGDAPVRHWFQLGRPVSRTQRRIVLFSWGGSMFEYLMPRLLLRSYSGTLLDVACRAAVKRQIAYGQKRKTPWGASESAFNFLDSTLDYQYRSFGVPGLGLKRGLGRDLVVAPYATALALAVDPRRAVANFERLEREGAVDIHGFYEALDYTKERLLKGQQVQIIRSHMAHHQGMTLVALANCLMDDVMPRRFHAAPLVRSAELLLQERVPVEDAQPQPYPPETEPHQSATERPRHLSRRITTAATPTPRTNLLSNGRYTVMVTNAGGGFSRCDGLDVSRWREDRTLDCWGQFCYVRDLRSGITWSAGHHPVGRTPDHYEVRYYADKADFLRRDVGIETHWEIIVSPEKNVEVRQLTLTNHRLRPCELEATSYAEIVLNPRADDLAHPAFGKMFLETEWLPATTALLCHRRTRSPEQKTLGAFHVLAVDGNKVGDAQFETDRARFLGRNRTANNPAAMDRYANLSGATGPVLDPIFSIRQRLRLEPGGQARLVFSTGVAETRDELLALADRYHDFQAAIRSFELAWAHAQVEMRHLQVSADELHLFQRLAGNLIFAGSTLRAPGSALVANHQGQPGLWRQGLSGDRPILLARISETEQLGLVRQLFVAHTYWRMKGLEVDLVVLNEHPTTYLDELHEQLQNLAMASDAHNLLDKPGGVYLRKEGQLSGEDRILLLGAARVVLDADKGSLAHQLDALEPAITLPAALVPRRRADREETAVATNVQVVEQVPKLLFWNGWGGFAAEGREYVIPLDAERLSTPAPWINVVANPGFGFLASEAGGGYTWAGNSQTNRLTPWTNDAVADPPGEIVYLRDEDTGEVWTATPMPVRSGAPAVARHGQGYTAFEQSIHGLQQELLLFVPRGDPVKLLRLKVRNLERQSRRLSVTFYAEWVLGTVRDVTQMHIRTELDAETRALLAFNGFNSSFPAAVAFADVSEPERTATADRAEFFGRNGNASMPAALKRQGLSGRTGAALDSCAALQVKLDLRAGEEKEVVFALGQAASIAEARKLVRRYRDRKRVQAAFSEIKAFWERLLTAVQVHTPNPGLDLLVNRWLPYQVLSCRMWARSAFYQSGGAYGFRDQLQDAMAVVYWAPEEARAHLLRAAGRQFVDGDVQHWWHPPEGRGVRTRFSDDLLWLPFAVWHYVAVTGDSAALDEQIPFLRAPTLAANQDDSFGLPDVTAETASVYEHCARALRKAFTQGAHGLPLMGVGDWNDGMNRVGSGGKGESVWVAWFLIDCLRKFVPFAERRNDKERATTWRNQAEKLRTAVEDQAWDGRWYRRAYFDDGAPLGSSQNDECQIDSIVQSWAVISGAADPQRARLAMQAAQERLIDEKNRLILLISPPFDKGPLHPGYIKGYVPGIRENGGQYTHAAAWVLQATALQGQGNRAMELFDLLNPIHHAATLEKAAQYRVEPYVVAGDVYSQPNYVGRGGWTWYTGSAGWLYRVALEDILGFQLRGDQLMINPCIPSDWPRYEIIYRYGSTVYHITVENPEHLERGISEITFNGERTDCCQIKLTDDRKPHEIRVLLRRSKHGADAPMGPPPPLTERKMT